MLASMGTRVVCSGDTGVTQTDDSGSAYEIVKKTDKESFSYSRLVFRDGLFVGYMLVGEPAKAFNKLQSLINTNAGADAISNILYN
jgi:nitrite reductase (NADH) large subunit